MRQLSNALKRRETFKNLSASQKNDVVQALNEASLRNPEFHSHPDEASSRCGGCL
jgi:alkyl hydroperoxide reductase subunit AhpF